MLSLGGSIVIIAYSQEWSKPRGLHHLLLYCNRRRAVTIFFPDGVAAIAAKVANRQKNLIRARDVEGQAVIVSKGDAGMDGIRVDPTGVELAVAGFDAQ